MLEWNEAVQKMIDLIEANIGEDFSLVELSRCIGYSPYYCSVRFHQVCGMTIKSYVARRRLALATLEIRDSQERIIDIAVKYGFSSQEALTRAFRAAFGCTPSSYRKNPLPIPLPIRKVTFFPEHYQKAHKAKGEIKMNDKEKKNIDVHVEFVPAHKYVGIWDNTATNYGEFWNHHDCDKVCGLIESMANVADLVITPHTAGWFDADGKRGYFYGLGVPADFDGKIPDGFEIRLILESYYLVFAHPQFDFLTDNTDVMGRVESIAWNYDIKNFHGGDYEWNESCQCYQRHYPEGIGYEILRPIRLKNK